MNSSKSIGGNLIKQIKYSHEKIKPDKEKEV